LPDSSPFSPPSSVFGIPGSDPATGGGSVTAGPMRLTGSADGVTRFSFSTSLREMARYAAAAEASKSAEAGAGFTVGQGSIAAARFNPFDIWVEGKYTNFRDNSVINSASNAMDGQFGLISVGADYVLNRWLLVGVMAQFDIMTQISHTQGTEASGRGWMLGPYATLRLSDHVFLQARGAWGQSSNEVNPFGTYTDQFATQRWLASSTLLGRWGMGPWMFRPSVSVAYMEDVSQSYADHFGIVIPSVKSQLGQAKAGPEIGYRYQFGPDLLIEPHVGMQVIYNFAGANVGVIAGQNAGPEGVRGRIEIGQRATTSRGIAVEMSGSYDGIGSKGYEAYTAKAQVHLPLQ
jgi:outer membrane autotransporter protein